MTIATPRSRSSTARCRGGVQVGDQRKLFTSVALPMMTRLRLPERSVLDTLVAAGVARSRPTHWRAASAWSASTRPIGSGSEGRAVPRRGSRVRKAPSRYEQPARPRDGAEINEDDALDAYSRVVTTVGGEGAPARPLICGSVAPAPAPPSS